MVFMKVSNLFRNDIFAYILLITACIVLAALFYFQPRISDDWDDLWKYQNSKGIVDYWIIQYNGLTGRLPLILLSSLIFPHPTVELLYRIFILVEVLLLIMLAWYCALDKNGYRFSNGILQAFLIFGMLFWLALPVRSETVSWLSGNFVYLVPAILCLSFMAWSKYCFSKEYTKTDLSFISIILKSPIWFLIGFLAGSSQEQVISACVTFTAVNIYSKIATKNIKNIPIGYWISIAGLFLGALFMIAAPGNYLRLRSIPNGGFVEAVERILLFIPGAFFEIGTENTGKSIWFGIIVLVTLFYKERAITHENIKCSVIWILVGLATLLTLLPATNQISPRTTFFVIIFLYIAVASLLFQCNNFTRKPLVSGILIILSLLVLVEALSGLISNISISAEFNKRWAIINANRSDLVAVPFIASKIEASLTYIDTPEHDRLFLQDLSRQVGFKVIHDVAKNAPLPASFKPLKAIKYHQR